MKNTRSMWLAVSPVLLSLMVGCGNQFPDVNQLERDMRGSDSPFLQTITRNGVRATIKYLPSDALLLRQHRVYEDLKKGPHNQQNEDHLRGIQQEIQATKDAYERSLFFLLIIGYDDEEREMEYEVVRKGRESYSSWMQKLMFNMQEYISLDSPHIHEIPPDLYTMERTFGMTKDRSFLIAFPRVVNGRSFLDEKWLSIRIREFGLNVGELQYQFRMPFENAAFVMFR